MFLCKRGVWGRIDTCITKSLCCPTENIITLLLTGYIPIQNKKFKKRNVFAKQYY